MVYSWLCEIYQTQIYQKLTGKWQNKTLIFYNSFQHINPSSKYTPNERRTTEQIFDFFISFQNKTPNYKDNRLTIVKEYCFSLNTSHTSKMPNNPHISWTPNWNDQIWNKTPSKVKTGLSRGWRLIGLSWTCTKHL